jgi:hypothetical protein
MDMKRLLHYCSKDVRNAEVEGKDGVSPLSIVARLKYVRLVKLLPENGTEINRNDRHQRTLLINFAIKSCDIPGRENDPIRQRQIETMGLLLQYDVDLKLAHGANTESQNHKGRISFMHAVKWWARDAALILLDTGASIGARDGDGNTALFNADDIGDIMQMLIERVANFKTRNNDSEMDGTVNCAKTKRCRI